MEAMKILDFGFSDLELEWGLGFGACLPAEAMVAERLTLSAVEGSRSKRRRGIWFLVFFMKFPLRTFVVKLI